MDYEITFLDPRDNYLQRTAFPEILDNDEAKAAMRILKHLPNADKMQFKIESRNNAGSEDDEPRDQPDSGLLDGDETTD